MIEDKIVKIFKKEAVEVGYFISWRKVVTNGVKRSIKNGIVSYVSESYINVIDETGYTNTITADEVANGTKEILGIKYNAIDEEDE